VNFHSAILIASNVITLYFIKKVKTKNTNKKLPPRQKDDRVTTMNTLTTITNSIKQTINETVIDDLTNIGFDHNEAVKMVVESDFDLIVSAETDPVAQF